MSATELSVTTPKARKQHRCIWCGEPILIGEKHVVFRNIFECQINTDRYHNECHDAMITCPREWDLDEGFTPHVFKRGTTELR